MNQFDLKRAFTKAAVILVCALLPAISSASQDTAMKAGNTASTSNSSGGRVYVVNGDVYVVRGNNPSHRVENNEAIISDTLVSTAANSSALLKFDDGQIVTMQSNSSFRIREYRYDANRIENSNIVFSMLKGGMRFVTGLIGKARKQAFRLATPNATIGIRGTEFMVVMSGKSMYSQVLTGKIAMTNAAGMKIVGAGQIASVASPSTLVQVVSAAAFPPAETFNELMSIPVDPSAIPTPAPAPVAPAAVTGAETGAAAASVAGAAGGLMAGAASSASESTLAAPEAVPPAPIPEPAQEPAETTKHVENANVGTEAKSGTSLAGRIGTLGLGAELSIGISDNFFARVGINAGTYNHKTDVGSLNYGFDWQLQSISAIADWYPYSGSFRASGGILYNNNNNKYVVNPVNGNYVINGNTYSSTVVASYNGTMTFNIIAPYIGIGWGNPAEKNKGWGFVSDIGLIYQGNPKSDAVVTCTSTCPAQLQADATAQNNYLQDNSGYSWWPVVSIGISYQW